MGAYLKAKVLEWVLTLTGRLIGPGLLYSSNPSLFNTGE